MRWFGLIVLAWMAAAFPAAAAGSHLFGASTPLKLTLTAPFSALVGGAKSVTKPYPATLSAAEGAGPAQDLPIQLRARGMTRRTAGFCSFPPLSIGFDKAAVKGTLFHGQHRLKLVTYCRVQPAFEQRIVLEHLVYRIYNLLTPMSFRVRPAEVTYRNGPADKGVTRFGFLIEDIDDVADRNGRDTLRYKGRLVSASQLDPHAAARAALFEFMIGNLDWEFLAPPAGEYCCHNVRLIAARKASPVGASAAVPVPYDFDMSGFVDSPYAGPPEGIEIASLKDRFYRGYCVSSGEIGAVAQEFRAHRAEMTALINGEPRLTSVFRTKTINFLDGFFTLLDDPAQLDRKIVKHCR